MRIYAILLPICLMVTLTIVQCNAQTRAEILIYKKTLRYLSNDTSLNNYFKPALGNGFCVYNKTIRTRFSSVIGENLQSLNNVNTDMLNKLDIMSNKNFAPHDLKQISSNKKCGYICFFSGIYKNLIYAEVIPYPENIGMQTISEYRLNYMGKIFCYMITLNGYAHFNVKKGYSYNQ